MEEAAGGAAAGSAAGTTVEAGTLDPAVHVHRQSLEQRVRLATIDNFQGTPPDASCSCPEGHVRAAPQPAQAASPAGVAGMHPAVHAAAVGLWPHRRLALTA